MIEGVGLIIKLTSRRVLGGIYNSPTNRKVRTTNSRDQNATKSKYRNP